MLDEVRYFGLTAASNGTITPLSGGGSVAIPHEIASPRSSNEIEALPADDRPRLNITLGGAGRGGQFRRQSPPAPLCARHSPKTSSRCWIKPAPRPSTSIGSIRRPALSAPLTIRPCSRESSKRLGANRRVYATVDPTVIIPNSVFSGPNAIDGVSLMTYDLGWWGNDPANPYQGEHSLPEYVDGLRRSMDGTAGSPNDRPGCSAPGATTFRPRNSASACRFTPTR